MRGSAGKEDSAAISLAKIGFYAPLEVLRGFKYDHEWHMARAAFSPLPVAMTGGEDLALYAATMYRQLRQQGITVRSAIDLMVGAWCIENEMPLLHADRDFGGMEAYHGLMAFQP